MSAEVISFQLHETALTAVQLGESALTLVTTFLSFECFNILNVCFDHYVMCLRESEDEWGTFYILFLLQKCICLSKCF